MAEETRNQGARWAWMDDHPDFLYRTLDLLPFMIAYVDRDGVGRYRNRAMQAWLGRDPGDRAEVDSRELLGSQYESLRKRLDAAGAGIPQVFERSLIGETGAAGSLETSYLPIVGPEGPDGFVVVIGDSTRRAASESMRTHAIIGSALLEERNRLAMLMHDDVLQGLFSVGLELDLLSSLSEEDAKRVEAAQATLEESIKSLRLTIERIARGGGAASPLPGLGLLVRATVEPSGIDAKVQHLGSFDDVPEHVTEQLLTVLAEALRNVLNHADASTVTVVLIREGNDVALTVADDGIGLDVTANADDQVSQQQGNLAALDRRARALGGSLTIADNQPRGTVLSWRVPLS